MSESSPRSFVEAMAARPLVFDGAMGTALYERGLLYHRSLDEACVSRPELVRDVHAGYLAAGADVLATNTFGANFFRLDAHGLASQMTAINEAAVRMAREVADTHTPNHTDVYVLGSVGPTGKTMASVETRVRTQIAEAFEAQCRVLATNGVDGFLLETFRQPEEIFFAIAAAKRAAPTLPIVACVSLDDGLNGGTCADGATPEQVAEQLAAHGVDAIGVNCSNGPAGVYEAAIRMQEPGLPVVALPNAGLPRRVDGRFAYWATPEYFLVYAKRLYKAGVRAVGGCCGTTALHIRQISAACRMMGGHTLNTPQTPPPSLSSSHASSSASSEIVTAPRPTLAPGCTLIAREDKGRIGARLEKTFLISVEVNPPPGLSLQKALAGAKLLRDGGVDIINIADGPRASARMGNLALCVRIQETLHMPALMHVTTRDRNLLGTVAHLLAAHELGVHNLVVITGDPPKMGDFPDASAVYDIDSIGLLRVIQRMNHGYDPGGKPMNAATRFLCATGAEPAARDYDREIRRLQQKIEAGADFIMTQPVYDADVLDRFLQDVKPFNVPVFVGLLPLASGRNAEFLHNEVPGMHIPAPILHRMQQAGSGEKARTEGIAIARDMLHTVKEQVAGAYIMPPFGRYELALRVIQGVVR